MPASRPTVFREPTPNAIGPCQDVWYAAATDNHFPFVNSYQQGGSCQAYCASRQWEGAVLVNLDGFLERRNICEMFGQRHTTVVSRPTNQDMLNSNPTDKHHVCQSSRTFSKEEVQ
ncbi:hypothetical protein F4815DRAFT_247204 [Daldinia loculata]|nr:hypothetical protein F4815DRAFT_247204 [Daldinia loculata]